MKKKHRNPCHNFMKVCVGDITSGSPLHIKFSGLGIIGLVFFMMFVQRLEHVRDAKGLLENRSLSPYLSNL